jgi:tagaturonate reductase
VIDAPPDETVCQAMTDPSLRTELEAVWLEEVLPVSSALGKRDDALNYLSGSRERLLNLFLGHRLADIAQNHVQKKERRIAPLVTLASSLAQTSGARISQHRLIT